MRRNPPHYRRYPSSRKHATRDRSSRPQYDSRTAPAAWLCGKAGCPAPGRPAARHPSTAYLWGGCALRSPSAARRSPSSALPSHRSPRRRCPWRRAPDRPGGGEVLPHFLPKTRAMSPTPAGQRPLGLPETWSLRERDGDRRPCGRRLRLLTATLDRGDRERRGRDRPEGAGQQEGPAIAVRGGRRGRRGRRGGRAGRGAGVAPARRGQAEGRGQTCDCENEQ